MFKLRKATKPETMAKAARDPHSLGNMLRSKGVTEDVVKKALEFQNTNPDIMLGEALVYIEAISREDLEEILREQKARRNNGHRGTLQLSAIARGRTASVMQRAEDMRGLMAELSEKLKVT